MQVVDKTVLYHATEWLVTFLVLLLGLPYLKRIIAFVLMELHQLLVQQNFFFR